MGHIQMLDSKKNILAIREYVRIEVEGRLKQSDCLRQNLKFINSLNEWTRLKRELDCLELRYLDLKNVLDYIDSILSEERMAISGDKSEEEDVIEKKVMHTSNLAMRFYIHEGWSLEELEGLVESYRGSVDGKFKFFNDVDSPYYVPSVGTNMKVKELAQRVSKIKKAFNDYPNETIEECIKRFNW